MDSELVHVMSYAYRKSLLERIQKSVVISGECKLWTKSCKSSGYPQIKVTVKCWGSRPVYVHRLVYIMEHGSQDLEGKHISHLCHHKTCCEVSHLSLELPSTNAQRENCKAEGHCMPGHGSFPPCLI